MAYTVAVQTIQLDDQVSAAAKAATDAMSKLADASDTVTTSVAKVGASASTLVNRFDPATKSASALETAQRNLANAQATLASAVANGSLSQDTANRTLETLQQRVRSAQAAFSSVIDPVNGLTSAVDTTTESHGRLGSSMTNLRIEAIKTFASLAAGQPLYLALIEEGHKFYDELSAQGQGMSALGAIAKSMWSAVASPAGVIVAAVAGLALLAYSADSSQAKLLALSTTLRATRDDYASMATEATAAAKNVAATTGFSTPDATAAAKSISSVTAFTGNTTQLSTLIREAGDLAAVLGISLPEAAEKFAVAMVDPGKAADDLANTHFRGMSDSLALQIKLQSQAGDTAGAFKTWLDAVNATSAGAAKGGLTTLGQATKNLSDAFTKAGQDGHSLADVIGTAINDALALAINTMAAMVEGIENLRQKAGAPMPAVALPTNASLTPDATGRQVLTSASGALGIMQVMPSTAAGMNLNPMIQDQNIMAGLTYIGQLAKQFGASDQAAISGAYNMGPAEYRANPSAAEGYVTSVFNANTSQLPPDVASQIQYWGQILGLPPGLIALGQRIAVVESHGQQFGGGGAGVLATATLGATRPLDLHDEFSTSNGTGLTPTPQQLIDKALTDAAGQGASAFNADAAKSKVDEYTKALAALAGQGVTTGDSVNKLQEALALANKAFADAVPASTAFDRGIQTQITDAATLAAAYAQGSGAVVLATAQAKAEAQARQELGPIIDTNGARVKQLTAEYLALAQTQAEGQFQQKTNQNNDSIAFLNTEISTLGMDDAARQVLLAHLKAEQDLRNAGLPLNDAYAQSYLKSVDTLTQLNQAYTQQKAALDGLASDITSAFGQVSQAITDSFLSGTGAAINWGNVTKSIIQQVVAEALKLTILNPILNNLFGQNLPTIATTFAAIGGLGGGGSGTAAIAAAAPLLVGSGGASSGLAASLGGFADDGTTFDIPSIGGVASQGVIGGGNFADSFGLLPSALVGSGVESVAAPAPASSGGSSLLSTGSNLLTGVGLLDKLGFTNIGGQFSSFTDSLGLTGANGLLGGTSGVLGGVNSFLGTSLIPGTVGGQFGPVTAGLAADGAGLPASLTVGSLIGGAGAGFGVGSLVGGFLQSSLNKTGPAPTIGAGVGALAGAAIGSIVPGIGTVIGGLLGGLIGGGGGGLIGPKAPSAFSSTVLNTTPGGLLDVGPTISQIDDASGERTGAQTDAATINNILQTYGATISGFTGADTATPSDGNPTAIQIGQNTPGGFQNPNKFASVGAAFPDFQFTATNPDVASTIAGRSFTDPAQLQNVLGALEQFLSDVSGTSAASSAQTFLASLSGVATSDLPARLQAIDTFVSATLPNLLEPTKGSIQQSIDQANTQFNPAIAQAQQLGYQPGVDQLTAARDDTITKAQQAATDQVTQFDTTNAVSFQAAAVQISGSLPDQQAAGLAQFDQQATQQREQLQTLLTGIYGDSYTATAAYGQQITSLDQTLAEQRLAIVQQNDQALAAQAAAKVKVGTDTQSAFLAAAATVSGTPQDAETSTLYAFDAQADQQRTAFAQSLTALYGTAYSTTADYAAQIAAEDQALGEQRLAITTQYAQKMAALDQQVAQQASGYQIQLEQAKAAVSGSPADANAVATDSFNTQSAQAQGALFTQLQSGAISQAQYSTLYTALSDLYAGQREQLQVQQAAAAEQTAQTSANLLSGFSVRDLTAIGQVSGSPADANTATLASFDAQATQEQQALKQQLTGLYGQAYTATVDYGAQVAALTKTQGDERLALIQQQDQQAKQAALTSANLLTGFGDRYATAAAQISGSPADAKAAALGAFDVQATQEQQSLTQQLTGLYGQAYTTTAGYAAQITALEKAQGEERLALAKQYDSQVQQTALQQISSLQQYALSLETSPTSPLSPQKQLDLAQSQFDTTAQKASGGDFTSIQNLQGVSQTYLTDAQTVFGSGQGYVTAFNKVLDALGSVGALTPDTLTASVYTAEARSSTQQITDVLNTLIQAVNSQTSVIRQTTAAPARLSA